MKLHKWIRCSIFAMILAIPLLTAGCGLYNAGDTKDANGQIDPPQNGAEAAADVDQLTSVSVDEAVEQMQVTLFFKDGMGFTAPLTLDIPKTVSLARSSLEYMVDGGPAADMLPEGFTALLPKGTLIKEINVRKDKLAIVDFSKEFTDYNVEDERKILEAITWTLTGFPTIDRVELRVEGKILKEMPLDETPLDEPLSRKMGINIEQFDNVDLSQSTPVTLYFLNQAADQFSYYVPVTRMIQRTDDIATAALQELIKGPLPLSKLVSVMLPDVEVLTVNKTDEIITVNLSSAISGVDQKTPTEALDSIILSLTENTGIAKVQLMVEGIAEVSGTDNRSYTNPVSRPSHINPYKL